MRRIHANTLKEHGVDTANLREAEDGGTPFVLAGETASRFALRIPLEGEGT